MLEASKYHEKKRHINSKGLKKKKFFFCHLKQAKRIIRKCPTCSFYNQAPSPAGRNTSHTERTEIWQMDVFHFTDFGILRFKHHPIDTHPGLGRKGLGAPGS